METTLPRAALGSAIQAHHLEAEALAAYGASFRRHPVRLAVLDDFLCEPLAGRLTRFLASEADFQLWCGLDSVGTVAEPDWLRAAESRRLYRMRRLTGVLPDYRSSPNALIFLKFRRWFLQPAVTRLFETIAGLELSQRNDFEVHAMQPGDYLRPHRDDQGERRLAVVLYLSRWSPGWGGALHLVDEHDQVTAVEPGYNRVVMFDVRGHKAHFVTTVESEGETRLSLSGWYHGKAGR